MAEMKTTRDQPASDTAMVRAPEVGVTQADPFAGIDLAHAIPAPAAHTPASVIERHAGSVAIGSTSISVSFFTAA